MKNFVVLHRSQPMRLFRGMRLTYGRHSLEYLSWGRQLSGTYAFSLKATILDYIDIDIIIDIDIDTYEAEDDRSRRITEGFLSTEMKYPWCLWWRSNGPFSNIVYHLLDKPRWILYDGRIAETISSETSGLNWLFLNGVWESKSHPSSRDNDFRRNYFIMLPRITYFHILFAEDVANAKEGSC